MAKNPIRNPIRNQHEEWMTIRLEMNMKNG